MKNYKILKNHVNFIRDFLLTLLFPINCLICKKNEYYLCKECKKEIIVKKNFTCPDCKKPNHLGHYCPTCQTNHELDGLWIISDYHNKILSILIKQFKYYFNKNIASILSEPIILFIKRNKLEEKSNLFKNKKDLIIIPVPLHRNKLRFRGFNQSEELAILVAKEFGITLDNKNLIRQKDTKAQAKLNRNERIKNMDNAFEWQGDCLKEKNIILLDDVSSTGATLNNCAKVLKENGVKKIWGLVLAKN